MDKFTVDTAECTRRLLGLVLQQYGPRVADRALQDSGEFLARGRSSDVGKEVCRISLVESVTCRMSLVQRWWYYFPSQQ